MKPERKVYNDIQQVRYKGKTMNLWKSNLIGHYHCWTPDSNLIVWKKVGERWTHGPECGLSVRRYFSHCPTNDEYYSALYSLTQEERDLIELMINIAK